MCRLSSSENIDNSSIIEHAYRTNSKNFSKLKSALRFFSFSQIQESQVLLGLKGLTIHIIN